MSGLADIALNSGAPIVARILKGFGPIGQLAGGVIEAVAAELGTEPTPTAIETAHQAEPQRVERVIRKVDADYSKIAMEANQTARAHIALLEGDRDSESAITRLWRPLTAILFAPACLMVLACACFMLVTGRPVPEGGAVLVGIVVPIMTLWAGFNGVYSHGRSGEKKTGAV